VKQFLGGIAVWLQLIDPIRVVFVFIRHFAEPIVTVMANQIDAARVIADRALLIPPNVGAAGVFERFPVILR